ncbi:MULTISPECIES: DUF305 domain-containing protein [unclassified Streptomyces]|uniref:DUF305 domain-containing protein n=1 Tax=unclassified Streptomyces TaxID=2593676 RepID=UPI000DC78E23|nr:MULTISPECIES: DUF305 domain-containing protein [unclassified Streptomyces]AWZ09014.1 DUF305 domain-containing protein [Streptomyces sp. ICC4]AWZ16822.1 DUF305 domain-containing protein [Streptomyces sp. ICC1]
MQLRRYVLTRRPVWALLAALLATGCTAQPVAGPPRAAAFNATDIAWIQLMIPMDERARLLTGLAPSRAGDPAVVRFAAAAADRQAGELAGLRGLLALSAAPDTRPHEGHDMPGMVSSDTVRRAGALSGPEFDSLFTASLRAHLRQSVLLCAAERASGGDGRARELAAAMERAGSEQLALLDAAG